MDLRTAAHRAVHRFVNGLDWWLRDPSEIVDRTPHEIVFRQGKLNVRHYLVEEDEDEWELGQGALRVERHTQRYPVLLVPPLMIKPFVYDLAPGRSYVEVLLREGFEVYLVDFGEPDRADEYVSLDHYVLEWMPAAIDATIRHHGGGGIGLVGYCMGGLFGLMHTSVNEDERVKGIVTIGAPIDSHEMGLLAFVVKHAHGQVDFLARRLGNIPGRLSSTAFKMMAPVKNATRYADLFINMWNDEYVNRFDALGQWTENFIDYPGTAFREFLEKFLKENQLKDGRMTFRGKPADLSWIRAPILAFAGKTDQVVPVKAAAGILDVVGSEVKELRVVPGGHMGVFAGSHAPRAVWEPSARFLARHMV
ncbi:MAG: alpha/beta fold hydrolase [Deltaproteobacteria bacterium]|nr:MAG: alpha/beta fold hydrolase [Deltaproteobacteria bacterium]